MRLNYIPVLLLLFSAHIAVAGNLVIKSNPEGAEIFIQSEGTKPVSIGKTPFQGDLEEIISTYIKSPSFMIELQKVNHVPYRVLLAKTTKADFSLSANLEPNEESAKLREHDLLMSDLFDIQRLIRGRSFTPAIERLNTLETKFPKFSIISELKATAYYLNKDIESALTFYRKAHMLNPENDDAYRMKLYLEKKLGVEIK